MEGSEVTQEMMKKSDPHGNLSNPLRNKKKSNENTDPRGNLANPLNKKQKESDENSEKANLYNQIAIREADLPQSFNLSRCQLKGKSVVEIMDIVDETIGIFQEGIIMEILSRLPVRSLHRFKCVSKLWKALISDPYFKKKHLNRANIDQNLQRFLVAKMCLDTEYTFSLYSSSLSSVQLVEDEEKLDVPSNCKPRGCYLLCTCDGLVLLSVFEVHGKDRTEKHLFLWNPSTRESIVLPLPKRSRGRCVYGIGYDSVSDDYKILAINFNTPEFEVSSEILAVKSGSWRVSEHPTAIRCLLGFREIGPDCLAFLHGAFHWLGYYGYRTATTNNNNGIPGVAPRMRFRGDGMYADLTATIVTFDISSEIYSELPLREQMCSTLFTRKVTESIEHGISVLGGMLCFYSTFHNRVEGTFKLWVMKEYGVKESWTVLLAIQDTDLFYSGRPKYRYADGEVLLGIGHQKRIGYVHRTTRGPLGLWPSEDVTRLGIVYTESLISPKILV